MTNTENKEQDDLLEGEDESDFDPAKKTPYTKREAWHAVWRHVAPFKKDLVVLLLLGILSAFTNGAVPYVTGRFFDTLIALSHGEVNHFHDLPVYGIFLALWVGIQFIANNVDWVINRRQRDTELKIRLALTSTGFTHLLRLPIAYHKNTNVSSALDTFSQTGWRVASIVRTMISLLPQFLSMVIGITLASSINYFLAGILLAGVVLYALVLVYMLRPIAAIDDTAHRIWSKSWDKASELVQHTETIKQAAAEIHAERTIRTNLRERIHRAWYPIELHWSNISFFQRLIVFCTQLAIFIFSVRYIADGTLSVGQLVTLNGYALMFFGPLVQLGFSWQTIQNGVTSAVHAQELLEKETEQYHPEEGRVPKSLSGEVVFDDVSFRYEEDQPLVLSHMNFTAKSGEVIALVGQSGGGKSTTIGFLSAYYFPNEGSVRIDGVDTRQYDLEALRRHIAVVPQEVTLFNDSIKNNIRYGAFDATDEDITRVVEEAHLTEFIATLPKGYDTLVGERGVKLSVGQKQRVAIARAILRNPSILILDEPTSALDAETEHVITKALGRLMEGRTTFIIAHRLSTVRRANTILVFDKGTIAESGTHDELLATKNGIYRNLYDHQIGFHG
jgi:ABC-type multidrug transport system fused ATPase/permease subunit